MRLWSSVDKYAAHLLGAEKADTFDRALSVLVLVARDDTLI